MQTAILELQPPLFVGTSSLFLNVFGVGFSPSVSQKNKKRLELHFHKISPLFEHVCILCDYSLFVKCIYMTNRGFLAALTIRPPRFKTPRMYVYITFLISSKLDVPLDL